MSANCSVATKKHVLDLSYIVNRLTMSNEEKFHGSLKFCGCGGEVSDRGQIIWWARCRQNSSRGGQILPPGNIVTSKDEIALSTIKL